MKEILDAILRIIQNDPHDWSLRPCTSCETVTSLAGYDFGCVKKRANTKRNAINVAAGG